MGFRLSVKGKENIDLGSEMIQSVHVDVCTPTDSMAKSSNVNATIFISGKLISNTMIKQDETLKLFNWSLVPAQNAEAYRDVTIKVIAADNVFRIVHFPNTFVIDYSERYNDHIGVGEFSLVLRQKADKIPDITADGGQKLDG
ncbi:hypothetical protein Ga0466249_001503 [Sporomusaceae bacterium BoRhaA]|uniref:membrane-associated protease 1 n=1 Tax=Pelorhabdus rhamnosifermentans TaxID=2772457 RepID=UPI001C0633FA|nr:membrane-associated protease 1 [Pelorhabdus rhamnosifermentans]MBU2700411.1 hypothetical protein [Pelorhabdus rhamnosifermentans]